jgi:hypothetical protein
MITAPRAAAPCLLLSGLMLALGAAGCAGGHTAQAPGAGVNLSGDWVLNTNLSDDAESLAALEKATAGKSDTSTQTTALHSDSSTAPQRMNITQNGQDLSVKAEGASLPQVYTPGAESPCGGGQCHAHWQGAVFVVDVRPAKGHPIEESYALDDEGHLIVTIQTGKVGVKLAYDRARS